MRTEAPWTGETTAKYLEADTYYTLQEAYGMLNDKAEGFRPFSYGPEAFRRT